MPFLAQRYDVERGCAQNRRRHSDNHTAGLGADPGGRYGGEKIKRIAHHRIRTGGDHLRRFASADIKDGPEPAADPDQYQDDPVRLYALVRQFVVQGAGENQQNAKSANQQRQKNASVPLIAAHFVG
jgi:hypothetical protein